MIVVDSEAALSLFAEQPDTTNTAMATSATAKACDFFMNCLSP